MAQFQKAKTLDAQLKRRYGIDLVEYRRLWDAQEGKCAICRQATSGSRRVGRLSVDHDHVTGAVRGLLCTPCNLVIGLLRDSPSLCDRVLVYLEQYRRD